MQGKDKKSNHKFLVVISGPTAVGKTAMAIHIAKEFNTSVINSDSRQFYKEMKIGTARPDESEWEGVPHFLFGDHSIEENYTVKDFERESLAICEKLFESADVIVVAGGSGLFTDALCFGLDDIPEADPQIRGTIGEWLEKEGLEMLVEKLRQLDPEYCEQADLKNPRRVCRALEVCMQTGRTFSSFRKGVSKERPFQVIRIALEREREIIYDRINRRVEEMMKLGLLEEVKSLFEKRHLKTLDSIGYTELFSFLEGECSLNQAVDRIRQHTRNYAKKQMTWLRRDITYKWFMADDISGVTDYLHSQIV